MQHDRFTAFAAGARRRESAYRSAFNRSSRVAANGTAQSS
jgi:recombinational DNA repair protein (RecF pathway)